jgi:hypothetical protein
VSAFFCVVLFCVGRGLALDWSPSQGVLPNVYRIEKSIKEGIGLQRTVGSHRKKKSSPSNQPKLWQQRWQYNMRWQNTNLGLGECQEYFLWYDTRTLEAVREKYHATCGPQFYTNEVDSNERFQTFCNILNWKQMWLINMHDNILHKALLFSHLLHSVKMQRYDVMFWLFSSW